MEHLPKYLEKIYKIKQGKVFPDPRYPWRNWKLRWEVGTGKKVDKKL